MTHIDNVNRNFIDKQMEIVGIVESAWRSLLPQRCGDPNIVMSNDDDPCISLMDGLIDIIPAYTERYHYRPGFAVVTRTEVLFNHTSTLAIGREAIRFLHQVLSDKYWQAQDEDTHTI